MWLNFHLSILAFAAALVPAGCTATNSFVDATPRRDSESPSMSASSGNLPAKLTAGHDQFVNVEGQDPLDSTEPLDQSADSFVAFADQEAAPAPLSANTTDSSSENLSAQWPEFDQSPTSDAASDLSEQGLDGQTLKLMNDYLSQVPFQERQELYQEWKGLDAEAIRRRIAERESQPPVFKNSINAVAESNSPAETDFNAEIQSDKTLFDKSVAPAAFEVPAIPDEPAAKRPVPLMEGLISGGSQTPPDLKPAGDAHWDQQLQELLAAAQSRADETQTRYLKAKEKSDGEQDKNVSSLRRRYIASQVDLRFLYLMNGDRGRALQAIPDIPAADQEFWRGVLWSIASYFDAESMPRKSDRMTQTVERLRTAINKLQGEANLKLRNVAFCRKITSFGNFERFDQNTYAPGQKVLLYAEIINFESVPRTSDGLYETRLASTIEILREGKGKPLQRIAFEPTVDLCRSYRQDYFHSYELKLPADLPAGPYVLKLSIEDVQSRDVAVYSLNFTVGNH